MHQSVIVRNFLSAFAKSHHTKAWLEFQPPHYHWNEIQFGIKKALKNYIYSGFIPKNRALVRSSFSYSVRVPAHFARQIFVNGK